MDEWVMTIVSSFIGGGVVTTIFNVMLGHRIQRRIDHSFDISRDRIQNELGKDLERYKGRLRLYEELYPRQIEAFTEIFNLQQDSLPSGPQPNLDWEDVVEHAAYDLKDHSVAIHGVLKRFGAILPVSVMEHLQTAQRKCDEGTYLLGENRGDVSSIVKTYTDHYFQELATAIKLLRKKLEVELIT